MALQRLACHSSRSCASELSVPCRPGPHRILGIRGVPTRNYKPTLSKATPIAAPLLSRRRHELARVLLTTLSCVPESLCQWSVHFVHERSQLVVVPICTISRRPHIVRAEGMLLPTTQENATPAGIFPHALHVVRLQPVRAQPAIELPQLGALLDVSLTLPPQGRGRAPGEVAQGARARAILVQAGLVARGASPEQPIDLVYGRGLQ
mmetsp:Transcript_57867/g.188107  ORF Transcript_57867/g.188107 Transcript_57867/m.188107 type:complete len:207 (+) Transcript_57867:285-905(+)